MGRFWEETHFYTAFGLTMAEISSKAAGKLENRFKYNGIELDEDLGLNAYEAHFRTLDPAIGRWWQIDPKIESMEMWSPYASNYNNPIRFSDPLGDEPCCQELWKDIKGAVKETGEAISRGASMAHDKTVNFARGFNQINPLASAVEFVTGKSSASDFTESKPRLQSFSDMTVNSIGLFGGEIAAFANSGKLTKAVSPEVKATSLIEQNAAQGSSV